ncbi:hypothetical protein [Corynebacterium pygosceleis]|uniref:hypothetical protein n=1 Tax=Corynebacterium pygosceleis TaxID=2800406 RepID=UPI002005F131|nr:hypothetical protein [Corynebacterium pygosceleis]MCK7676228.1 hypothetical protein [Corynebacterium pygosceleis]
MADLGQQHAQVLYGSTGSADDVLTVFRGQARWLAQALRSTVRAMETIDGVNRIQLQTSAPGPRITPEDLPFPDRPEAGYRAFTFNSPAIGGATTLTELSAAFAGTDTSAAKRAEQAWTRMSTDTADIADELDAIAHQITDLTEGQSFEQAAHTITAVADNARIFSGNARIMGHTIARLNPINSWAQTEISLAQAAIEEIKDPEERDTAERVWVESFLAGALPAAVAEAVPPISHLMQTPSAATTGYASTGGGQITVGDDSPSVAGGVGTGAAGTTADRIATAQAGGATVVHPGATGIPPAGVSAAGVSGAGVSPVVGAGAVGGVGSAGAVTSPGGVVGVSGRGGVGGAGHLHPGGPGGGPGGPGGGTGGGPGGVRTGSGAGRVGGVGVPGVSVGSGGGQVRAGAPGVPGGGQVRAGAPGGVPGAPVGSGVSGQSVSGGAPGGVGRGGVTGGVPVAGGGRRERRKASMVLSQVERSGNLERILGPAPLTVPPVIGDWARGTTPPTQR